MEHYTFTTDHLLRCRCGSVNFTVNWIGALVCSELECGLRVVGIRAHYEMANMPSEVLEHVRQMYLEG